MTTDTQRATAPRGETRRGRVDVLTWPLVGHFLKWRHARVAMQAPLLLLAGLMLFDGLLGPQLAPKNLATVGAWLHYRGLVVLALLIAGNLFCMACPFMLPRRLGRYLREHALGGGRHVPGALRNKWLAVALTIVFFYVYERYSLWASPWLTAWVALGYFLAAFVIDTLFTGAAFCKYVCPLGQFNFVSSLMSPLEVKVREPHVCTTCHTKDCIMGRTDVGRGRARTSADTVEDLTSIAAQGGTDLSDPSDPSAFIRVHPRPVQLLTERGPARTSADGGEGGLRGCELWLFQPGKAGNMDCTFCLDCVHACPYDNVGIMARLPTSELWRDPYRSGIGHFSRRPDLAALGAVLIFASFVNAFNMVRPIYALRERLAAALGLASPQPLLLLTFALGLIVLPALLLILTGWLTVRLGRLSTSPRLAIQRYVYALAPLGFGMWVAHYSFHFLTGGLTIVPVVQAFLVDVGLYAGAVQWSLGPVVPGEWLFPIEAVFLYLGATGSLITACQIARHDVDDGPAGPASEARLVPADLVLRRALPWMALTLLLLAAGLWILVQPMDMRGTLQMVAMPGG